MFAILSTFFLNSCDYHHSIIYRKNPQYITLNRHPEELTQGCESILQVCDDIIDMLGSNGEADGIGANSLI